MDVQVLKEMPPWDWPDGTDEMLLDVLRDRRTAAPDRLLAAEMAGNLTVINDDLVGALLAVVGSRDEADELRSKAAISLGPILEDGDTSGFEDADDVPIAERTFRQIEASLRELYADTGIPKVVRRRILEASVRAPQDWHRDAIRTAYSNDDEPWRLTAVFCMRFVRGFDAQILDALESTNPDIQYEAVIAAGTWAVDAAWRHVATLVTSDKPEKALMLAAIDAVAGIRPREARAILSDLTDSDDEDIVEAVYEALAIAEAPADWPTTIMTRMRMTRDPRVSVDRVRRRQHRDSQIDSEACAQAEGCDDRARAHSRHRPGGRR